MTRRHIYEPTKPYLYQMIKWAIAVGDLDIAWKQLRVLRRRAAVERVWKRKAAI